MRERVWRSIEAPSQNEIYMCTVPCSTGCAREKKIMILNLPANEKVATCESASDTHAVKLKSYFPPRMLNAVFFLWVEYSWYGSLRAYDCGATEYVGFTAQCKQKILLNTRSYMNGMSEHERLCVRFFWHSLSLLFTCVRVHRAL